MINSRVENPDALLEVLRKKGVGIDEKHRDPGWRKTSRSQAPTGFEFSVR